MVHSPAFTFSSGYPLGFCLVPGFAFGCCTSFKPFLPPALAQQAPPAIIFQALRRLRGAVLFRSSCSSSSWGSQFWLLRLTVQLSGPAYGGPLTFGVRLHRITIMHLWKSIATVVICIVFAAACKKTEKTALVEPPTSPATSASTAAVPNAPQGWLGTWIGQEGMVLKVAAKPGSKYEITIIDPDREDTYEGVGGHNIIYFERNGIKEQIRATDGDATGMKWLADKSTCLTIKEGEGYCRD